MAMSERKWLRNFVGAFFRKASAGDYEANEGEGNPTVPPGGSTPPTNPPSAVEAEGDPTKKLLGTKRGFRPS